MTGPTPREDLRDAAGAAAARLREAERVLLRQIRAEQVTWHGPEEDAVSIDASLQLDVAYRAVLLAQDCVNSLDKLVKP